MAIATRAAARRSRSTIGGQEITFETGKLAKQADGAVVVRSGDTMVLATAQGRMEAREGADFFPLTVDVEERMYAAGKIPGGFFKREGRPTERAILTARMIDRPIRPLWPKGFRNEVQVICTVLSADLVTPHDILCINGASAALMISPLPFLGPVGAVRIGLIDGELVVNPTLQEIEEDVDARPDRRRHEGRPDDGRGRRRTRCPRRSCSRRSTSRTREIVKLCEAQEELRAQAGKPKWLDPSVTARARAAARRRRSASGSSARRPARGRRGRRGARSTSSRRRSRWTRPRRTSCAQLQVRSSLDLLLEKQRLAAVEGPVREQFESDLRALTEAEQDSKELKSAKRQLLFERIIETVELPFPVGPATVEGEAPTVKDSLTKQYVKQRRRGDLQGPRPPEDRGREAPPGRPRPGGDPPDRVRGRRHRRARTAPASSRAARRRSCRCSRSARRRRASGSTTSRSRPSAGSCTTTTSRPTRSGRRASCAARSAATSATARSRSGRSRR